MKGKHRYIIIALWLAACGFLGLYLPKLPFIKEIIDIDQIKVYGTKKVSPEEISKIFSNQNWFFLNEDYIQKTLHIKYPFIKNIEIKKLFVGEIQLDITEREPFAVLLYREKRFIVDTDGKIVNFYKTDKLPKIVYKNDEISPSIINSLLKINSQVSKLINVKKYIVKNGRIYFISKDDKILVFDALKTEEGLQKLKLLSQKVDISNYKYMNFCFDSMVVSRR